MTSTRRVLANLQKIADDVPEKSSNSNIKIIATSIVSPGYFKPVKRAKIMDLPDKVSRFVSVKFLCLRNICISN